MSDKYKAAVDGAKKKVFDDWMAELPVRVVNAVLNELQLVDGVLADCYRTTDTDGHYKLVTLEEPHDETVPITCKLLHGADSFAPGIVVFGVALTKLVACNCGHWDYPTSDQIEETKLKVAVQAGRMRGHTKQS